MTLRRPIIRQRLATADIDASFEYYARQAGVEIAVRFINDLELAFESICEFPSAGSSRYAQDLNLPGIRHRRVAGFPHLVFYREYEDRIDIVRVLHGARDIPSWLNEDDA